MAVEFICDGCGKRERGMQYENSRDWHKPWNWFQRSDKNGIQDACSRECVEVIAKKTGKTGVVLPI